MLKNSNRKRLYQNLMNVFPLVSRNQPGIYIILCLANDYRYVGQSSNIASRFAEHKRNLRRNKHSNECLQQDFNFYGEKVFEFTVLYMGNEWKDKITRLRKESQLIMNDLDKCYNTYADMSDRIGELNGFFGKRHSEITRKLMSQAKKGIPNIQLGRKISIEGILYQSIADASRELKHSRKMIQNRVNNSDFKDWFEIENA